MIIIIIAFLIAFLFTFFIFKSAKGGKIIVCAYTKCIYDNCPFEKMEECKNYKKLNKEDL